MPLYQSKTISPKSNVKRAARGFTLIELLIVISIIGILAAIIFSSLASAKKEAYYSQSLEQFKTINTALELYANDNGTYPPDANRDLPTGLEKYLGTGDWPKAPYPNSVYDWDNWAPGDLAYPPNGPNDHVYQISIRFCTGSSAPGVCTIPNEPWATNFDYYSAFYYCISGPCRPHSTEPMSYPGKCVGNCP